MKKQTTNPLFEGTTNPLKFIQSFNNPWKWIIFSCILMFLDWISGPHIQLSNLFILPVAAASWHYGLKYSLPLALLLPWLHLGLFWVWDFPPVWATEGIHGVIGCLVFISFALMIYRLRCQADDIRQLRRTLPVCTFCKKVRDTEGVWHEIDSYISSQSNSRFSCGLCPSCLTERYSYLMSKKEIE